MKLIAKKPCNFAGEEFRIGDEIPAALVLDPVLQEKRGILRLIEEQAIKPADEKAIEPAEENAAEPVEEKAIEPATKKAPAKKGGKKAAGEAGEQ